MRDLKKDSRAVAGFSVGAFRAAVHHVFEDFKSVVHEFMRFVAVNVHNHSDTTGIVFVFRVIKPLNIRFLSLHNS